MYIAPPFPVDNSVRLWRQMEILKQRIAFFHIPLIFGRGNSMKLLKNSVESAEAFKTGLIADICYRKLCC